MNTGNPRERGNILFYILIAITLLAALIYAVAQSGRGSVQQVNEEKTKLLANEIIDYASAISNAYAQLRLRGCKIEQISFENATLAGYANASAPSDKSCNIFDLAGGGITYKNPPAEAIEVSNPIFSVNIEVVDVGTTCGNENCTDMIMFTGALKKDICTKLNEILGVGSPGADPPTESGDTGAADPFTGYIDNKDDIGSNTSSPIRGRKAGCYKENENSRYYFYKVLQER